MRWWSGEGWTDHVRPLVTPAAAPVVVAPVEPAMPSLVPVVATSERWTSNYTDDELTLYTSRGQSAKPVVEGPRATTIMADGRTFISFDRDEDGIPDPPPLAGRAWAAALMPAVAFALFLALFGLHSIGAVPAVLVFAALAPLPFGLVFEILDGVQLRRRGYPAPGLGFHLLGTFWYLVRRITRLNPGPGRGVGPLVAYLVSSFVLGAALGLLGPSLTMTAVQQTTGVDPLAAASQHMVADTIETSLAGKGIEMTVDCSAADVQVKPGSTFECTGTSAADGSVHRIPVTIGSDGTASFTVDGLS